METLEDRPLAEVRGKDVCLRVAVCLGGTTTNLAVLDGEDRILEEQSIPTFTGGDLMEVCKAAGNRITFMLEHWEAFTEHRRRLLDELGRCLKGLVEELEGEGRRIAGAGVSAPGAVHPHSGEIMGRTGALNLPAWGDFNLAGEIADRTGLDIRVINDAKAMALGALTRMPWDVLALEPSSRRGEMSEEPLGEKGRSMRDFIEIDPGTGLGGAYVVGGRIWFGPDADDPDPGVGEIWKLPIDPDNGDVNFEELASARSTIGRVEGALLKKSPDQAVPLLDKSRGRIKELLKTAPPHLKVVVEEELKRTGTYLGRGIEFLMTRERERLNAPDIRSFVIGGGLVSGLNDESKTVRRLLYTAALDALRHVNPLPKIYFSVLGGRAGLFGSAALLR